jgi:hypothetical protein
LGKHPQGLGGSYMRSRTSVHAVVAARSVPLCGQPPGGYCGGLRCEDTPPIRSRHYGLALGMERRRGRARATPSHGHDFLKQTRRVSRVLLGNAHLLGLRVNRILQADTRHQIPNKRGERFTQVRGPRRGKTLTSCLSDLDDRNYRVTMG